MEGSFHFHYPCVGREQQPVDLGATLIAERVHTNMDRDASPPMRAPSRRRSIACFATDAANDSVRPNPVSFRAKGLNSLRRTRVSASSFSCHRLILAHLCRQVNLQHKWRRCELYNGPRSLCEMDC